MRVGLLVLIAAMAARAEGPSFTKDIAPILQAHCLSCHSGTEPKGDFNLTTRAALLKGGEGGPAVVPGKPSASRLVKLVTDKKMPPKKPLTAAQIQALSAWVADGAKWEGGDLKPAVATPTGRAGSDFWSLQPIRRPPVPTPTDRAWGNNPVDDFIKVAMERKGIAPNVEADRRTLIRRLSLDLTGLWPTPAEVEAFVRDPSPLAYERLVDRLLASSAYGERWGRHWLDIIRFAESHGYEVNTLRPTAWPFRDYVIRAFNRDTPFPQFIREQLAGDTLPEADTLAQAATGFVVAGPHDLVGNETEEGKRQQRSDDLFDMVSTTATAFLGITAGCARCHDHKFDPVSQRDFYAMEAFFAGVDHAERPMAGGSVEGRRKEIAAARRRLAELDRHLDDLEPLAMVGPGAPSNRRPAADARRNVERFAPVEARFLRMTIKATGDGSQPCIDEIEVYGLNGLTNVALATSGVKASASSEFPNNPIHKIAHLNDGQHGNGRSWISNEAGRGWAQLEWPKAVAIARVVWGRDREQRFKDRLAVDYSIDVSLDGTTWTTVASSADRGPRYEAPPENRMLAGERAELQKRITALESPPAMYAGKFRKPDPTYLLKRGDVMQRSDPLGPATIRGIGPTVSLPPDAADPERRRALADWIADPANPLPARVLVNRLWHYHFGQGLVRTPSDFGFNGDRPSHPELLDWLAAEVLANGGQMKPIHRLMVMSRTYRQASTIDPAKAAVDADNRLVWRYRSRRVEAEAVRDNVLQAAGVLNREAGGAGYDLWDYSNYVTVFSPKARLGPAEFRRMVYQFKPRTQQDRTFGAFDCPDATAVVPKRQVSTTALQALNMLNDPLVHQLAQRFESRLKGVKDPVASAFEIAFQREPTADERTASDELIRAAGLAALCRMLLNANEFVTIE